MAVQWQTFPIEFKGGLISNMSPLQQGLNAIGSATILQNMEPDRQGGYTKIRGYQKYTDREIPGTGKVVGLHVVSGGRAVVARKVDAAAVKQAVKTILQTNFGEKPFQPYFGANIRELLFENVTETTMSITLARNIRFAIEKYEPRAVVEDVEILDLSDRNSVYARITFRVINTQELVVLDTAISRIR